MPWERPHTLATISLNCMPCLGTCVRRRRYRAVYAGRPCECRTTRHQDKMRNESRSQLTLAQAWIGTSCPRRAATASCHSHSVTGTFLKVVQCCTKFPCDQEVDNTLGCYFLTCSHWPQDHWTHCSSHAASHLGTTVEISENMRFSDAIVGD